MRFQDSVLSAFGSLISNTSDSLLTIFYPQSCQICEKSVELKSDGSICTECWEKTHIFNGEEIICEKCSAFLKKGLPETKTFCRRCETDEYDVAFSVGLYEKALAVSILNLKKQPFLPAGLRKHIHHSFDNLPFRNPDLIIPVPLSVRRLNERGFNQASIISQVIAKHANLPIDEISLGRTIHTEKHRAGMDRKSRAESVQNAFEVKRPRLLKGKNILLVDDVFTSGATASACAKVLKRNGANKVYVFTIARAF